jgi:hypothetical protein
VGLAAFAWLAIEGWRQFRSGEPLTAWAILAPAGITCAAVVLYLPLAWDRYLLPLQPWSALLVAGLVATTWSAIARALARSRRPSVPAPE